MRQKYPRIRARRSYGDEVRVPARILSEFCVDAVRRPRRTAGGWEGRRFRTFGPTTALGQPLGDKGKAGASR